MEKELERSKILVITKILRNANGNQTPEMKNMHSIKWEKYLYLLHSSFSLLTFSISFLLSFRLPPFPVSVSLHFFHLPINSCCYSFPYQWTHRDGEVCSIPIMGSVVKHWISKYEVGAITFKFTLQ